MKRIYFIYILFWFTFPTMAQGQIIPFDTLRWDLSNAEIVEHLGRISVQGAAILKDVDFTNGVIDVDIAVSGKRSYPGVVFRIQSMKDYERFYIRPHRSGLYPDVLQYTPVINQVAGWQLYHGEGFTEIAEIPENVWNHLRIEVKNGSAQFYWNDMESPALIVPELQHGISTGTLGIYGPANGTAYFSNFNYQVTEDIQIEFTSKDTVLPNLITEWELSKVYKMNNFDLETLPYPFFYTIFLAQWETIKSDTDGLVNVSKFRERSPGGPDGVMVRKIFYSDKKQILRFNLGYSDEVAVYMNGKKYFYGNSSYQSRDKSFTGILGFNDALYLPVEKGMNELLFFVKEAFGGWGLKCQSDIPLQTPVKDHSRLEKVWETTADFLTPESVLYDKDRNVLYVTNFDSRFRNEWTKPEEFTGYISILDLKGNVIEKEWITQLHAPTGICISNDKLYTLERRTVTEIDPQKGVIINRFPLEGTEFMNDIAADSKGNFYITNTSRPLEAIDIYKFSNGKFSVWEKGTDIHRANGCYISNGKLLIGNTGDGLFKSLDLETKKLEVITSIGAGVFDGIRLLNNGKYIVSKWEGKIYIIEEDGSLIEIFDGMSEGLNTADFEYVKEENLLVIPTFLGNKVVAYRLKE